MLDKIGEKIGSAQAKKPLAFIAVFALLALLLAPGALLLIDNVEPSLEKVLPQDVREVALLEELRSDYRADQILLVVQTNRISDVRDEAVMRYARAIKEHTQTIPYVVQVYTPADILTETQLQSTREIKQALAESKDISPDRQTMLITARVDTGADAELITQVTDDLEETLQRLEPLNPGVDITITGYPAIDKATFEVIISDFSRITLLSFALVAVIVALALRSFKRAGLALIVVMNAMIWTFGIVGYLGLTITVVSMVAAAMIMGLGIDFGIHTAYTYTQNRKKMSKKKAVKELQSELLRALSAGSFTTMAGFLALLFGVLPAMKVLGIILAIGIFSTLIGAVFLLPPLLIYTDGGRK